MITVNFQEDYVNLGRLMGFFLCSFTKIFLNIKKRTILRSLMGESSKRVLNIFPINNFF
jgi:hypothetical protein